MNAIDLSPDCSRCAALCCVAFAFDKSDKFAFDKPAGTPCLNLSRSASCSIHKDLDAKGFSGCVAYQCDGAGQRVTQDMFKGHSWQDQPHILAAMQDAFFGMRAVHARLALLATAENLPLEQSDQEKLASFRSALGKAHLWPAPTLSGFGESALNQDIHTFIKSLARYVSQS